MADLRIDLAAEFRGKKAFTQASKSVSALDKSVDRLGKRILSVFAASKIIAYSKASVKAFTEDEASANRLATSVKNLGLAFAQPQIDSYIAKLEASSSVADDELRPAFQALLTTTGSLTKSQELLATAIDGSRGSGVELKTVAQDLANAYVGNTKGLKKYNLGLTQAELKTMSFTKVQAKFNKQFSGASAAYLNTYSGQLSVLAVAAGNAQEVIGKGLVDALVLAAGKDGDVQDVADAMANLSDYTADAIRGVGVLAGKLTDLDKQKTGGFLSKIFAKNFELGWIGQLNKLGAESTNVATGGSVIENYNMTANAKKTAQALAKADREAKKRQAEIVKAQQKNTAELKKQAAIKKAGSLFDLEQIQLIAALKTKLSDEDRKRVELQLALLTGNVSEASKLAYEVAKAAGLTESLARSFANLPDAKNPFQAWDEYLNMLLKKVQAIVTGQPPSTITNPNNGSWNGFNNNPSFPSTNVTPLPVSPAPAGGFGGSVAENYRLNQITVQIDGKAVATALQDQSLSGIGSSVNRTYGGFGL